ncbi:hypothetical protein DMH18_28385 [Streptomyces sp. WAC 06783]|nr:hypothetical protein DMH18_28385 [Streptomyces sp. WAC 06783]
MVSGAGWVETLLGLWSGLGRAASGVWSGAGWVVMLSGVVWCSAGGVVWEPDVPVSEVWGPASVL